MNKFIEINIDNELNLINIDNIALIKQVNSNLTELTLFTKDNNNIPTKIQIAYNYNYFKNLLQENNKIGFNFILNNFKQ